MLDGPDGSSIHDIWSEWPSRLVAVEERHKKPRTDTFPLTIHTPEPVRGPRVIAGQT